MADQSTHLRTKLESLIDEMLDGQLMLDEAVAEFEKVFIQKALERHNQHLSRTASLLGIHRNTLTKKITTYRTLNRNRQPRKSSPVKKRKSH
ncbi:MAG: helix-turn-helix domain-containing protein [Pyrinomonadaceae bacterium]